MDKYDILRMSREENRNGDEREEKLQLRSYATSAAVGAFLCMIYVIVEELIFDRSAEPIWGIYSGMMFTKYLLDSIKLKKKSDIILSVVWGFCCLLNVANYILDNVR